MYPRASGAVMSREPNGVARDAQITVPVTSSPRPKRDSRLINISMRQTPTKDRRKSGELIRTVALTWKRRFGTRDRTFYRQLRWEARPCDYRFRVDSLLGLVRLIHTTVATASTTADTP